MLVATSADSPLSPRKRHALELFAGLPVQYAWMGALLSFGQDPRWRRALVAAIDPTPSQRVLDVATGTGLVASELVRRGRCEVIALDQSDQMLEVARKRMAADPALAGRVTLVRGEADDPRATLRELARVLKPGGRLASLEFGLPPRTPARVLWRVYTRIGLPALGRLVSRDWYEVGRFLGPSIEELHAREPDLSALWRTAGIAEIRERRMSFGAGLVMWGIRNGHGAPGS